MQDPTKRTVFFYAILAATLLPILSLVTLSAAKFPFDSSLILGIAIFAGGVGHVGSTACIYADKSVREVMKPMKWRFFALPIVIFSITAAAYFWGASFHVANQAVGLLFGFHLLWLHFHYQKQNYGLVAFVAASTGNKVPRILSQLLLLPALAGYLAVMPTFVGFIMEDHTVLQNYRTGMFQAAVVVYLIGGVLIGITIFKNFSSFKNIRTAAFTAAAVGFYLPAILLQDTEIAFWSYALAHGFQYLLMVFTVAGGTKFSPKIILAFALSLGLGGFLLHRLEGNQAFVVCGILLTWVHFVLDAKIWKMSEPGARKLLRERFGFLFH